MNSTRATRPRAVIALIGIELFNGVVGVASGLALVRDPSGEAIGVDADMLRGTPIGDYTLVGWLLFMVYGIIPIILS